MNVNNVVVKANETTPMFYPIRTEKLKLADYQRDINYAKVKSYVRNYDPDIFGVVLVSHRDDNYYVIDGQHRVETAKALKIPSVLCQVVEGLTYEEEAEKFYKMNTSRVPLNSNHKFHALVENKNKMAIDIINILNKYGLTYSKNGASKADNCVVAVAALQTIYRRFGAKRLDEVMNIIKIIWNGERNSLQRAIIKGINTFMENYTYEKKILIKVLEQYTAPQLLALARSSNYKLYKGSSTDMCFYVAKTIRDIYDEYARKKRISACGSVVK